MNYIPSPSPQQSVSTRDILGILWRRAWVVVLVMAVSLGTAYYVTKKTPKRYRADAQLLLIQRPMISLNQSTSPTIESVETQVGMLQSLGMMQRVANRLKNEALTLDRPVDGEPNADELAKDLTVFNPKETNLITVSMEAATAERAADLANTVAKEFIAYRQQLQRDNSKTQLDNLTVRTQKALADLNHSEIALKDFKNENKLVDITALQTARVNAALQSQADVERLQVAYDTHKIKVDKLDAIVKAANLALGPKGLDFRDDAGVKELSDKLADVEMRIKIKQQSYRPDFPLAFDALYKERDDIKRQLAEKTKGITDNTKVTLPDQQQLLNQQRTEKLALIYEEAQLAGAKGQSSQAQSRLPGLPEKLMMATKLENNVKLYRGLYDNSQAALSDLQKTADQTPTNVQIAQSATPPDVPFRPQPVRDLLFGGAIGLFLSFVSLLLLEQGDRRVRSLDTVRRFLPGPIVGAMPALSRGKMNEIRGGRVLPEAIESYSLARANIALAYKSATQSDLWDHQVILVTSAIPGEGKSTTAAQLARTMARSGKKVVLIDADLRRPAQNSLFGTAEPIGLADVLENKIPLNDALVSSDTKNLSILHSGHPDQNATDLIAQPQMEDILRALRADAEVILIDTPACSAVADALLLAPHADCILHVIGNGLVDEDTLRQTVEGLRAAEPGALLFFMNRAPRDRSNVYKHYYSTNVRKNGNGSNGHGANGNGKTAPVGADAVPLARLEPGQSAASERDKAG